MFKPLMMCLSQWWCV